MADVDETETRSMLHPAPFVSEAALRSGGVETRYHRAGRGRTVLLLAEGSFPSAPADRLFEGLSRSFRVIRPGMQSGRRTPPGVPADPTPTTTWIREIIDGLGLGRCALVAEGTPSLSAAWLAFTDPARVSHLVLCVPEPPDPPPSVGSISDLLTGSGRPVMLTRSDPELKQIVEFLLRAPT